MTAGAYRRDADELIRVMAEIKRMAQMRGLTEKPEMTEMKRMAEMKGLTEKPEITEITGIMGMRPGRERAAGNARRHRRKIRENAPGSGA